MDNPPEPSVMTFTGALIENLPIVIGGVIGLLGTILGVLGTIAGGVVIGKIQARREEKKEYFSHLERLITCVYECEDWLDRNRVYRLIDGPAVTDMSPIYEAKMLVQLYVPELQVATLDLELAMLAYLQWVNDEWAYVLKNKKIQEGHEDRFGKVHEKFLDQSSAVVRAAGVLAQSQAARSRDVDSARLRIVAAARKVSASSPEK